MSDDIVERLLPFVVNEMRMPAGLTITVIDEIERLRAEVERLQDEKATLRRNEWRLIWGLCTECGANRDKEASRER
jgi:hypothetical protein